jgi:quinol monooxygenase YgiN
MLLTVLGRGKAKIAIIVEYQVPQENRAAFDVQLRKNEEETLRDEGCLRMEILQQATAAGHVVLHELWTDEAWIEQHRQRQVMVTGIKLSTGC